MTAAIGRAIYNFEIEAGKNHIEASLARANNANAHAKFFASRETQARDDVRILLNLMHQIDEIRSIC